MRDVRTFAFLTCCFLIMGSVEYVAQVPVTTVILKRPYDILLSYDELQIKMLPGSSDYRSFNITAYEGNTRTDIDMNFTDDLIELVSLNKRTDYFDINETHYYTMYINAFYVDNMSTLSTEDDELVNLTVGNYTGVLNATILQNWVSNYTNITIEVLDDGIGRIMLNVTDNAGQPVSNARVTVYYNLSVTERGYTDNDGIYFTHFYDYGSYILMSIRKEGYLLKGYSKTITEPLHVILSELKGSAKLEWSTDFITIQMPLKEEATLILALQNAGTAKEQDIKLNSSNMVLEIRSSRVIDEIIPGGYANVTFYVYPKPYGVYGDTVTATGKWSSASAFVSVIVALPPEKKTSLVVPIIGGVNETVKVPFIPKSSVSVSVGSEDFPLGTSLDSVNGSGQLYVECFDLKLNYPRFCFVTVRNTGDVTLRDLRLSVDQIESLDVNVQPDKYSELRVNDSKTFLLKLTPLMVVESGNINLRIKSQTFETIANAVFSVKNNSITIEDLFNDFLNYNSTFYVLKQQVMSFKSKGLDTSYAENYLSLISEKLLAVETAISAGDIFLAQSWINEIAGDFIVFAGIIDTFVIPENDSGFMFLLILIIFSVFMVLLWRKKNKLLEKYSLFKRWFLKWWILKKLR